MNAKQLVLYLETQWDEGGFLDALRRGAFDERSSIEFIDSLKSASISNEDFVPKRLLSLTWYLPIFLIWQKERVSEISGIDISRYERFVTQVESVLEEVLGVP